MKVFRGLPGVSSRLPCALAIGNFDGVHCGHRALLAELQSAAVRLGLQSAVMTFEPHPREFFAQRAGHPEAAPARISNLRDKLQALADIGIDRVIVEHFNTRFATLDPQAFIESILVSGLQVKWLLVGKDFRFGSRRSGDITLLQTAGREHGFEVTTLADVTRAGTRVSSSAVRQALGAGDLDQAKQLLGRPYAISGHVIHGRKLGRNLGFPTANLRIAHKRPALSGIFVVQVHGLADQPLPGVASLGKRPTVENSGQVLLETHVFDYNEQCYGRLIQVEFLKKLRDEEKYNDLPTLQAAIADDARRARAFFQEQAEAGEEGTALMAEKI